jgi:hypothetical protein
MTMERVGDVFYLSQIHKVWDFLNPSISQRGYKVDTQTHN